MATIVEDVVAKTQKLEVDHDPKCDTATKVAANEVEQEAKMEHDKPLNEPNGKPAKEENSIEKESKPVVAVEEEKIPDEVEPKTGTAFPVKLADGKQLKTFGVRKKTLLGLGIKIYSFGLYGENDKLKELMRSKITKAPAKPSKEMYQVVVDSDVQMTLRMVIVYGSLTMNMVKKNFDEGLGASIKKLNGGKKDEGLSSKVLGAVSDNIKLTSGSLIEVTKLPGFVLETKVKGEVVSSVESELLCRAYFNMYLGDDPFDKEAKEKFGVSLLSLF